MIPSNNIPPGILLGILVEGVLRSFHRNGWVLGGERPPLPPIASLGALQRGAHFSPLQQIPVAETRWSAVAFGGFGAWSLRTCAFYHSNSRRFRARPCVTCVREGQGFRRPPALCDTAAVSAWLVGGRSYLCLRGRASRRCHSKCPARQGEARGCVNYSTGNTSVFSVIISQRRF